MKIQYWGTAAAEGVPGIFCSCDTCKAARIKKGRCVRTRSQLLINDDLLVDFGPDTFAHTLKYDFDMSLKGEFVRLVYASDYSDEEKAKIIRYGILALQGEEI